MAIQLLAAATSAIQTLSNLILVTPQNTVGYAPQSGIYGYGQAVSTLPALLFNYEGEQTATLTSDITDHYVESNTAIQDMITLRPEVITTHGFIGELNDVAPAALELAQTAASKLTVISAYTPVLSTTALLAYNQAFQAYQIAKNALSSAVSAWSSLSGSGGTSVVGSSGLQSSSNQNQQQSYFQQFYGYWFNRTLFTVQTPWAIFQNMAIAELRAIQDESTNTITDFQVTFKMIRIASTTASSQYALTYQGRSAFQTASLINNGTSPGQAGYSLGSSLNSSGLTNSSGALSLT